MTGEPLLTVYGNLTADPELRFTPAGAAVANFTVAMTPRTFDKRTNEWKDGDALFMRCTAWRELGEHIAASLGKGSRVVAVGLLKPNSYTTKEGEKRTVMVLECEEVGASMKWNEVSVQQREQVQEGAWGSKPQTRTQQGASGASTYGSSTPPFQQYGQQDQQQPANDPWTGDYDEPPF